MTRTDIKTFMNKFKVGDIVVIPKELAELTHEEKGTQIAEVVGLYRNFFNIKYPDLPFQQSIQYKDGGKVNKLVKTIA